MTDKKKSSEKRYSVIVFDLGNTLIRFDHNIAARKIVNLFRLDTKKIYDLFFDSQITRDFEKGLMSPKEFHCKVQQLLGIHLPYNDFVSIWNDIFWEDKACCELARRLKRSSYKLFLISNVNRLHFEYIRKKFDVFDMFDELILSFMVGSMKPDKHIFDDLIRRAGGDKAKLLYIDDRDDLVREARILGIESIKYEGADKLEKEMKHKGVTIE